MCTYSRYFAHGAGSDMAMKQQLVRMVNIMNKLNNVEQRLRRVSCEIVTDSKISFFWQAKNVSHNVS